MFVKILLALFAALLSAYGASAATAVPANGVISSPGEYYLAANKSSATTDIIYITANNVELDLNRKTVTCTPANPATATNVGIKITGGNVTVYDGKITGCYMGSHASGSPGNVAFLGVDFTANTYIGAHGGTIFIGNTFAEIGGYNGAGYAIGINAPAHGCVIYGSTFRNLHRQANGQGAGEGVGVLISSGTSGCLVESSRFENDELGTVPSIGVWAAVSSTTTIRDNNFTNLGWAVANRGDAAVTDNRFWMRDVETGSVAIDGTGGSSSTTSDGNVIIDFDNAYLGTVSATGDLILP